MTLITILYSPAARTRTKHVNSRVVVGSHKYFASDGSWSTAAAGFDNYVVCKVLKGY